MLEARDQLLDVPGPERAGCFGPEHTGADFGCCAVALVHREAVG